MTSTYDGRLMLGGGRASTEMETVVKSSRAFIMGQYRDYLWRNSSRELRTPLGTDVAEKHLPVRYSRVLYYAIPQNMTQADRLMLTNFGYQEPVNAS